MAGGLDGAGTVRRRTVLGGVAVLLAGCSRSTDDADERPATGDGRRLEPVELAVVESPDAAGGSVTVPTPGTVTVVDLFATWCAPCVEQLDRLRIVHAEVGEEVRFVSVTNEAFGGEFTAADLRGWWADHGGPWTVAHDAEGALFFRLDATGIPHTAVVDPNGQLTWSHRGVTDAASVIEQVDAAGTDG